MGYVVVYDAVSYQTGDPDNLNYVVLSRGDTVPSDVPSEQLEAWQDAERFPPYGAVQKEGSKLGNMLRSAASVAEDPAETRRRMHAAAGEDAALTDPAMDPSDEEKSGQDPGVVASRRAARMRSAALRGEAGAAADESTGGQQLEDMTKADLQEIADGLGVDYAQSDTKAELVEKIRAGQSSDAQTQE
jgi:hypothetical protein